MLISSFDMTCPKCKKPLQTAPVNDQLGACIECGARIIQDDAFRSALAKGTANGARIEKVAWSERGRSDFIAILFFFLLWPLTFLRILNYLVLATYALIAAVFLIMFATVLFHWFTDPPIEAAAAAARPEAPLEWAQIFRLVLIIGTPIALFFILPRIEPWLKKLVPNQFAYTLYVLASTRGLVISEQDQAPMLLPWSSLIGCSFITGTEAPVHTQIQYLTADGGTALMSLPGEEFAEVYDFIRARFGDKWVEQ